MQEGVWYHECEEAGCTRIIQFDDEPKCFTHSPDSGSSMRGYSARNIAMARLKRHLDENLVLDIGPGNEEPWVAERRDHFLDLVRQLVEEGYETQRLTLRKKGTGNVVATETIVHLLVAPGTTFENAQRYVWEVLR